MAFRNSSYLLYVFARCAWAVTITVWMTSLTLRLSDVERKQAIQPPNIRLRMIDPHQPKDIEWTALTVARGSG